LLYIVCIVNWLYINEELSEVYCVSTYWFTFTARVLQCWSEYFNFIQAIKNILVNSSYSFQTFIIVRALINWSEIDGNFAIGWKNVLTFVFCEWFTTYRLFSFRIQKLYQTHAYSSYFLYIFLNVSTCRRVIIYYNMCHCVRVKKNVYLTRENWFILIIIISSRVNTYIRPRRTN